VVGVPDQPGMAARTLSELSKRSIPVDMIVQASAVDGRVNHISLMSPKSFAARAKEALGEAAKRLGAERVELDDKVAKVSVIGTGFRHHSWVATRVFETLAHEKINLGMIMTSDIRISVVVGLAEGERALRALHRAFKLSRKPRRAAA
jgi:aspartate kinase